MASNSGFWRPGADRQGSESEGVYLHCNPNSNLPLFLQRQKLPIYAHKNEILYGLEQYQVLILVGETGTGKSTQLPLYLLEAGWAEGSRCIACTQPRRIAAVSLAQRVAEEFGCPLGEEVGYSIRFDSKVSKATKIKFCTDGLLLRETLTDPLLSAYSVVIVDEAHERSLNSDILLGLLKKIMKQRPEFRVIVTSATVSSLTFKNYFNLNKTKDKTLDTSLVLKLQNKMHPVDIMYLEQPTSDFVRAAVETVVQIHEHEGAGDVLVFLTGGEDIDDAIRMLKGHCDSRQSYSNGNSKQSKKRDVSFDNLVIKALYSSLPSNLQMAVFEPTKQGFRKVIFATNIAETSITIEGIKFVVDSGFVKTTRFDFHSGTDFLVTVPVSKAACKQRAGRAGRTSSGKCYRLMTEESFDNVLSEFSVPEMQRSDISSAVLQLKALGVDNILRFDFISPPSPEALIHALEILFSIGALDQDGKLTKLGESISEMPIDLRLAKCLLSSFEFGCTEDMLIIAAMCSVESPFVSIRAQSSQETKRKYWECISEFVSIEGDHITLLNVFKRFLQNGCDKSWCDSMNLQLKILKRAKEIHSRLHALLKKGPHKSAMVKIKSSYGDSSSITNSSSSSKGDTYDTSALRKCLISGYFANVAKLAPDGQYRTIRGSVHVSPHSSSFITRFGSPPEWVIFHEIVFTNQSQIREVTRIDPMWLLDIARHYYALNA